MEGGGTIGMIEAKWPLGMLALRTGALLVCGGGAVLAQTPASPGAVAPNSAAPQEIRAQLFAAEKTYAVNRRLAALKSVGQLELDVSQAEIEKAKADVAISDAAVSKCSIVAPFSGVAIEQKAREFQYTTPGQPLLEVLDDRNLEVEFIAPSRWLAWLKPGYRFSIRIDETGKSYPAHITALGARVDPVSQSIKITGVFNDASPELISGMSGRIEIAPE